MPNDPIEDSSSNSTKTKKLPLIPLREMLVFPTTVRALFVGRAKSIEALEEAQALGKEIFLASQVKSKINDPSPDDIYNVGTVAEIVQLLRLPDDTVKVLVEGKYRARIKEYIETDRVLMVETERLVEKTTKTIENEALCRTVKLAFDNYVRLNKNLPQEVVLNIRGIEDESKLSDTLIGQLKNFKHQDKQRLLEETDPRIRLEEIYSFIQSELEIMRVEKKIRARVKRQMEKTQKEYYLNEQMQAIQKELGDRDSGQAELTELENQITTKKLSKEAKDKLSKEMRKLKMMSPMAAEATVVRNYIDTVLSLPWNEFSNEIKNVAFAEKILDQDHYGLKKVKDRIVEYLSVSALVENPKGPILCLVGPPGVGKTSLAKSIAKATGREFSRMSLGGVQDEAEIRGHRRTYIGSMPGKIIQSIKKTGVSNPVILLDEIDKLSNNHRGDPAAALLEVLDPQQNSTFQDHYLDLDFDLSKVLFIATANNMQTIPAPLLDRLEMISLSGYTEDEKIAIASQYLVNRQLKNNGLDTHNVAFDQSSLRELVQYYTREAGVRNLEREIGSLCRKVARKHLKKLGIENLPADVITPKGEKADDAAELKQAQQLNKSQKKLIKEISIKEKVTAASVKKYLGPRKYRIGLLNHENEVGICTGLAYTSVGGELLEAEIVILPGKGKLSITGKLGEVMQESAQAALSYVRSRSDFLAIDPTFYAKNDIHIHIPEGAIPKDGPSAGICMATALTSALTEIPVNRFVAMTGEVTLRGRVLPIGGLKEKLLAAVRGGIKKVLIPMDNKRDIAELPTKVKNALEIVLVDHMDTVLLHALAWDVKSTTAKDDDQALFEKLRKINEAELKAAEQASAH